MSTERLLAPSFSSFVCLTAILPESRESFFPSVTDLIELIGLRFLVISERTLLASGQIPNWTC